MSLYSLEELGARHSYRHFYKRNPDNSGNPAYAKRGKRSQRFAELPPVRKFKSKAKRQEKVRTITKKDLLALIKNPNAISLLDAGYEILISLTQTVRKEKIGAVTRYVIKGN